MGMMDMDKRAPVSVALFITFLYVFFGIPSYIL